MDTKTLSKKLDEAQSSISWLDDLKVWPQDVNPKAKDTEEFYTLPEKPTQKELMASLRNFRADVKQALGNLAEIAEEQNRFLGELEAKFTRFAEVHRHQNGPGTWTGKPEA